MIYNFNQHLETAKRAYYWSSFDPDKRAEQDIKEITAKLLQVRDRIKDDEIYLKYEKKLVSLQLDLWHKQSRCISSAVTGPANFPVRRAEKANIAERKAADLLLEFWKTDLEKFIHKNLNKEDKRKAEEVDFMAKFMEDVEKVSKKGGYFKNLVKSNIQAKIERLIFKGNLEKAGELLEITKKYNVFTSRNSIFTMYENKKQRPQKPTEYIINGVRVFENKEEDRLQLFFDGKPEQSVIDKLKKNGWRWSPRFGAWQRKNTANAKYDAKYLLNNLKKEENE